MLYTQPSAANIFLIPILALQFLLVEAYPQTSTRVILPIDDRRVLENPGMGWSYGYFMNNTDKWGVNDSLWAVQNHLGPVFQQFPGIANAFIRLGWSYFYHEQDRWKKSTPTSPHPAIDWSRIENVRSVWAAAGKKVAFCIVVHDPYSTESTGGNSPISLGNVRSNAPGWIRNEGARGRWMRVIERGQIRQVPGDTVPRVDSLVYSTTEYPPNGTIPASDSARWSWTPDYDDPVFLRRLGEFLDSLAKKFDGRPDVDFIEIGSLGTWGEGHQWPAKELIRREDRLAHIQLWASKIKKTRLIVPDDLGMLDTVPLAVARTLGMGMADHSILIPNGNESPGEAVKFSPTRPVVIENANGSPLQPGYYQAVLAWQASYIRINNYVRAYQASPSLVDSVNFRLGYRLQITRVEFPATVNPGEAIQVKMRVRNAGAAPCHPGGFFSLHLFATGEKPIFTKVDTSTNLQSLPVGGSGGPGSEREIVFSFTIPATMKMNMDLYVSAGDDKGTPIFALPYEGLPRLRYYKIADLRNGAATLHGSVLRRLSIEN